MGDVRNSAQVSNQRNAETLLQTIENIYNVQDLDELLERALTEARAFARADAGTLYLKAKDQLFFSFVQNDTLFTDGRAESRYVYSSRSLAIDRTSLAGYVASTGEPLVIDDVYHIQSDVDYSFNPEFDVKSSYKTRSMLIVPLRTRGNAIVGVFQLINAQDENGEVVSFSDRDRRFVAHFAHHAANAIEKAKLTREMVIRMVEVSELRDPFETGQHAKRVGAYSAELYDTWAHRHHIPERKLRRSREILKTAAILHDVGKVAVSDTVLKKPGPLTQSEMSHAKAHTVLGARLFRRTESPWDRVTRSVVLNHHERWDGTGYPGYVADLNAPTITFGPGKKGTEIPLSARIVAIADVFDSLVSERAYKSSWPLPDVLEYCRAGAGTQFDPELVELFLSIQDVVAAIRRKYSY